MTNKAKLYDQYFTPPGLAEKLIGAFTIPVPSAIGDFAAGDGKLLCAAEKRWPGIRCTAVDIDDEVISKLHILHNKWLAHCCDFTDENARNKILVKHGKIVRLSAIALNPPFSIQKGKVRVRNVFIAGNAVRCSPALAFIIDALFYLKRGGQLVAIVPHSVLQNAQDAAARKLLLKFYGFEVVEIITQAGFTHCAPRTAIVRFTAGKTTINVSQPVAKVKESLITVRLLRGSISNTAVRHSNTHNSVPFVHTTDLNDNRIIGPKKCIDALNVLTVSGPAVLIPRVGKPNIKKIAYLSSDNTVILSDCVIAVECVNENDTDLLHRRLFSSWASLEQNYGGTCARYISVNDLRLFLEKIGCQFQDCLNTSRNLGKAREIVDEAKIAC